MSTGDIHRFYCTKEWLVFREIIINERSKNGTICEECGRMIDKPNDIHIHHTPIELTLSNYLDKTISLNPDNVKMVCKTCHDKLHDRFSGKRKKKERGVYIVCGAPMSGKTSYVLENMTEGDIIVDIDKIYAAVSGQPIYNKPENLRFNVFAVKNLLIDNIKTRYGNFRSAWIVGGYPNKAERERLAYDIGAEIIMLDVTKEECIMRLNADTGYRGENKGEWRKYIEKYFEELTR